MKKILFFICVVTSLNAFANDGIIVTGKPNTKTGVAIEIVNRSGKSINLNRHIHVEQLKNGKWENVSAGQIMITDSCTTTTTPSACVTLNNNQILNPPEWFGTTGDAQCACDKCSPVNPGTYRFVVYSCDEKNKIEGIPFEMNTSLGSKLPSFIARKTI